MPNSNHNPFTTVHTEGALLPPDLLQRIITGDSTLGGLDPESYHLPPNEKLNEAINRAWNRLLGAWATFQTARGRLKEGEAGTTLTRERWLLPLFQELGYGRLQAAKPVTLDGKEYRVSHGWGETPIHLVGCGVSIDRSSRGVPGASKSSPHSLVQELLNRNPDQLWGMVTNGLVLRVLRDNASLTRQAYVEFDLEAMLTGEVYADFVVLWMVCHQSRVESREQKIESCWLEVWSKAAQEQGTRALEKLRVGVENALNALGSGFLAHPANSALKAKLRSGELTREDYYRQLLRLVYRLIFLFAAEDRDLLLDPDASPAVRERYMKYYSATRLRQIAESSRGGRHPDLYATLRLVTAMLGGRETTGAGRKGLGLPVLGSFLFSGGALPDLELAELENGALLSAVRSLASIMDGDTRRVVDYKNLGTRELGSVYESLLELHPQISIDAGTFILETVAGNERKTTGSYYTAEDLIKALLDSALDPVILQALRRAGPSIEAQIAALLALKVCDPACGSGHFLIAAARRIARRLAQLRSGDEEPSPEMTRTALRDVIQHCVYGVDINPLSVELCKVNLWLESLEPGKPLSFLESHIQCGDSLVGVAPGLDISEIPDEAFKSIFGADKVTASILKKRNKAERAGQIGFDIFFVEDKEDLKDWIVRHTESFERLPEETAEQVGQKAQSYQEYLASPQYRRRKQEYDLWTAAFFWKMEVQPGSAGILAPTQEMLRRQRSGGTLPLELIRRVDELARRLNFLHWELVFPKVFAGDNPGFDVVIGNPPWESLEFKTEEYFANKEAEITNAANDAVRTEMINALQGSNPKLYQEYIDSVYSLEQLKHFVKNAGRFKLTSGGTINIYALFADATRNFSNNRGRVGVIVPTSLATDWTYREFFRDIASKNQLVSLHDFQNRQQNGNLWFDKVDPRQQFCLLTISASGVDSARVSFFTDNVNNIRTGERCYGLSGQDILRINPNTLTVPVFRNGYDAELTRKIYSHVPALILETEIKNNWSVVFKQGLFNISGASPYFREKQILENDDFKLRGNHFVNHVGETYLPVYEDWMIYQYDHRYCSHEIGNTQDAMYQLADFVPLPRYWIHAKRVTDAATGFPQQNWFMTFRDRARSTDTRTCIFSIVPVSGVTHPSPMLGSPLFNSNMACVALANFNSLVFDFVARQKLSGYHLAFYILKQQPVLPPNSYTPTDIAYIAPKVLELVYTAYDLRPFAKDMWDADDGKTLRDLFVAQWESNRSDLENQSALKHFPSPESVRFPEIPFVWNETRRAQLRAELDAYYARLYGLTRDELRYILDPQEVHGPDFPGETFRVLKDKEMRQYGEYHTRRLVLEAWDRLEGFEPAPVSALAAVTPPEPQLVSTTPPLRAVQTPQITEDDTVEPEQPQIQPTLSDLGLYKCQECGKMVMGFEKDDHLKQRHGGQQVVWKKMS